MKVLLVAKPWKGGLAHYLFRALNDLFPGGVRWIPTYPRTYNDYLRYHWDKRAWRAALVRDIAEQRVDLALFVNHLQEFRELDYDARNILWVTDAPVLTPDDARPYGRIYLSDDGYRDELLRVIPGDRYGGELPFACLPSIHHADSATVSARDVCFIGNRDPARDPYMERLISSGASLTVYGNYFMHHRLFWRHPTVFRPRIANERMGTVYAAHRVSVNIHARIVRAGTNMRTFECAGYGIPQVLDFRPNVERYFEPGKEVAVGGTPEEVVEQSLCLLRAPGQAANMAQAAHRRVLAEHTYAHRMARVLKDVA